MKKRLYPVIYCFTSGTAYNCHASVCSYLFGVNKNDFPLGNCEVLSIYRNIHVTNGKLFIYTYTPLMYVALLKLCPISKQYKTNYNIGFVHFYDIPVDDCLCLFSVFFPYLLSFNLCYISIKYILKCNSTIIYFKSS